MSYAERPEAIDTRWIVHGYSIIAGLTGFVLFAWGPMWLGTDIGGQKWAKAALIRVFGAVIMGAACCAEGIARVDRPFDRRRATLWFIAGHCVVVLALISRRMSVWEAGIGEIAAEILMVVICLMLYLMSTADGAALPRTLTTLFGGAKRSSMQNLRSRYEQQIREAAPLEERNRLARDLHDSIKHKSEGRRADCFHR